MIALMAVLVNKTFYSPTVCIFSQREGLSKFNKIYEFDYNMNGRNVKMVMTSVSGHMLTYAFPGTYKNWERCSPLDLFSAPVFKVCPEESEPIKVRTIYLHI